MSWNYRVIKHKDKLYGTYYGLHEVYYHKKEIYAWSEDPMVVGDTVEEIKHTLELMLSDFKKSHKDIVDSNMFDKKKKKK